jgi:hypothetical protein
MPVAAREPWSETFRVWICEIRADGREWVKILPALLVSPDSSTAKPLSVEVDIHGPVDREEVGNLRSSPHGTDGMR